jgi:hypothetical protein
MIEHSISEELITAMKTKNITQYEDISVTIKVACLYDLVTNPLWQ